VKGLLGTTLNPEHFDPLERELYERAIQHLRKFGGLPSRAMVEGWHGESLPKATEVSGYYIEELRKRWIHRELAASIAEVKPLMNKSGLDPLAAFEELKRTVSRITTSASGLNIVDFKESAAPLLQAYKEKLTQGDDYGILTGWGSLDQMMGGMLGGDVISVVGRPALGKTFMMLRMALQAFYQNKTGLFVSMEMKPLPILQRLAAMHTHKSLTNLKNAELTSKGLKQFTESMMALEAAESSLYVVDGNLTATVDDIMMLAQQLEPQFIVIDGAYLVRHPNSKINKYDRVAENAEAFKSDLAGLLNIPVATSWQFNREAAKKSKKKGEGDPGLEDIGYSDVIGQVSTVVLGLLEHEGIETAIRRKCSILKGRNGEVGEFLMNWDFLTMNFDEYDENKIEELQFL
jgi:replicative DNA helicase